MILALVLSALSALPQPEDPPPTAFVGARIHTVNGPPIEDGTLIVVGSKIVAVGPASETAAPAGAKIIDASGKTIIPGLICTHSHLGGTAGADGSGPIQPDVRVSDSLNVRDSGYRRALAGGLTTLNCMPGSGHLLSGQTAYLKLRPANTIEDMFILDPNGEPMGGMKMANGTNSMRGGGPSPAPAVDPLRWYESSSSRPRSTRARSRPRPAIPRRCPTATSGSRPWARCSPASGSSTTTPTATTTSSPSCDSQRSSTSGSCCTT